MAEGISKEMADLQTDADNFLLESREGRSGYPKGKKQFCSNKDASEVRDYDRITKRDLSDLSDLSDFNITVRDSEGSLSQLFQ